MTALYRSEQEMVEELLACLTSGSAPWSPVATSTEFDYANGRTDVIALLEKDTVLALEAKLTRWRDALQQAYRNTCFAHRSLVVLPRRAAERAWAHRGEFLRRNIGLCSVHGGQVVILIEPGKVSPLLPHLTLKALARLDVEAEA